MPGYNKKTFGLLIGAALFIVFGIAAYFYFASNAEATGGAFTNTKHGGSTAVDGGAWCPSAPCGVNRALGGEYGYYSDAADGGKYQAGECSHCHDLHMSFGGSEQNPTNTSAPTTDTTTTPDPYALFAPGTKDYCFYCHETMSLGVPPDPGKTGWGYWRVYQGKTKYNASAHVTSGNMKWPGANAALSGNITTFPRNYNRNSIGVNAGDCVNCHTPHGMQGTGVAATTYDTTTVPITPTNYQLSSASTDITTSYLIPRMLVAWEEALCLNCHRPTGSGGTTATPDIATAMTKLSGHPVDLTTYAARHRTSEYNDVTNAGLLGVNQWNSIGANTRHSECVDCHNPHVAQAIPAPDARDADSPANWRATEMIRIRGPLLGGWGVKPTGHVGVWASLGAGFFAASNWGTPNTGAHSWPYPTDAQGGQVTNFTKVYFDSTTGADMYEAYLCLKCHSQFAWGNNGRGAVSTLLGASAAYTQTDVTRDFNPRNFGYHPVFNRGQNRPGGTGTGNCSKAPNANFNLAFQNARGIYCDSYITCTDCHQGDAPATDPRGPHGSANNFILRSNESGAGDVTYFCHNCHNAATYGTATGVAPTTKTYSHVEHAPAQGNSTYTYQAGRMTAPMPDIGCFLCHGGGRFGGLHGSNEPAGLTVNCAACTTERGKRLVNGAEWMGWGSTGAGSPSCNLQGKSGLIAGYTSYSACARASSGASGSVYNYTYAWTAYDP